MIKVVDAKGDACPIPVVKTKNAIKELGGKGIVETMVDNEIAVQNLTKMAQQSGYGVRSEKIDSNEFRVVISVDHTPAEESTEAPEVCIPNQIKPNKVVVISSDKMGEGNDELGKSLLKAFIYALSQQDELPQTILFYNGGAKMTCEDSPAIEDLKTMEAEGVEILTCGTCLNFYGLSDRLQVGGVTNMYVIVEKMAGASLIIKP